MLNGCVCYVSVSVANFNVGPINEISVLRFFRPNFRILKFISLNYTYVSITVEFHSIRVYICERVRVEPRKRRAEKELKASLHFTKRFVKPIRPVGLWLWFCNISQNCFWCRLFVCLFVSFMRVWDFFIFIFIFLSRPFTTNGSCICL